MDPEPPSRYNVTGLNAEDTVFLSNRAKINQVWNPTLRYMLKAIASVLFGRYSGGIMQQDDQQVLWSLLYGRSLKLGQFIVHFLDRQSKKTIGGPGCGGVITSLASQTLWNRLEGYIADQGPLLLNYATLKNAKFLNVDEQLQCYILQHKLDHFPFPDVQNTAIHGYHFQDN